MGDNLILLAIPLFIIMIGAELWIGHYKAKKLYRFNDTITNLLKGIGQQVMAIFSKAILLGLYIFIFKHTAIDERLG